MTKRARAPSADIPESLPECFELNVGGFIFAVSKDELLAAPTGRLQRFASGEFKVPCDADDHYFLAEDGVAFEAVMAYVRGGVAIVPRESTRARVQRVLAVYFDAPVLAITEAAQEITTARGFTMLADSIRHNIRVFCRQLRKRTAGPMTTLTTKYAGALPIALKTKFHADDASLVGFFMTVPADVVCTQLRLAVERNFSPQQDIVWFLATLVAPASSAAANEALAYALGATDAIITRDPDDEAYYIRVMFESTTATFKQLRDAYDQCVAESPAPPPPESAADDTSLF